MLFSFSILGRKGVLLVSLKNFDGACSFLTLFLLWWMFHTNGFLTLASRLSTAAAGTLLFITVLLLDLVEDLCSDRIVDESDLSVDEARDDLAHVIHL